MTVSATQPLYAQANDIWRNISVEPVVDYQYDGLNWDTIYTKLPCGQSTTDNSGAVNTVINPEYNKNKYNINRDLDNISDIGKGIITSNVMPDYEKSIYLTSCNTAQQVSQDSFVCLWGSDPYKEQWHAYVGETDEGPWNLVGYRYDDVNGNTQSTSFTFLVPKDWYFCGTAEYDTAAYVYPLKGGI